MSTKKKAAGASSLIPLERISRCILLIRGQKVMLDSDLAALYQVETRVLIQAVKRNLERFPEDFMFQLTREEFDALRSQSVISNAEGQGGRQRRGAVTEGPGSAGGWGGAESLAGAKGRGGRRSLPYVFTEQGVAMLSSVLRSDRAIRVNIEIMRAFVRLRQMMASQANLARKVAELEKKYDAQFKVVFDAIRELMAPPQPKKKRPVGFVGWREAKSSKDKKK